MPIKLSMHVQIKVIVIHFILKYDNDININNEISANV